MIGSALPQGLSARVIYALSFWHYELYFLAYVYRAVPLSVFKRDAILMKCAALATLGAAYFSAPLDWVSMCHTKPYRSEPMNVGENV